jgi:hypothetical protein
VLVIISGLAHIRGFEKDTGQRIDGKIVAEKVRNPEMGFLLGPNRADPLHREPGGCFTPSGISLGGDDAMEAGDEDGAKGAVHQGCD